MPANSLQCPTCGQKFQRATPSQAAQAPQQPMPQAPQQMAQQPVTNINVAAPVVQRNALGTAGFVLALVALFLSWIPFLGWILWLLGAVLSVIGIFRAPKGLAIAGTVISFIGLILLIIIGGTIGGLVGLSMF